MYNSQLVLRHNFVWQSCVLLLLHVVSFLNKASVKWKSTVYVPWFFTLLFVPRACLLLSSPRQHQFPCPQDWFARTSACCLTLLTLPTLLFINHIYTLSVTKNDDRLYDSVHCVSINVMPFENSSEFLFCWVDYWLPEVQSSKDDCCCSVCRDKRKRFVSGTGVCGSDSDGNSSPSRSICKHKRNKRWKQDRT